jgi:hypothetical protein
VGAFDERSGEMDVPCREREEEDFEGSWWQGKRWPGPTFERRDHRCGRVQTAQPMAFPSRSGGHVVGGGAGALEHGFSQHVAVHSRGVSVSTTQPTVPGRRRTAVYCVLAPHPLLFTRNGSAVCYHTNPGRSSTSKYGVSMTVVYERTILFQ